MSKSCDMMYGIATLVWKLFNVCNFHPQVLQLATAEPTQRQEVAHTIGPTGAKKRKV